MVDREFYKQDYKLKVEFYTGQFQRMWTRFNLFLTLETGLVALLFVKDSGALTRLAAPVALVEILISAVAPVTTPMSRPTVTDTPMVTLIR
jgi:hypothetical protein